MPKSSSPKTIQSVERFLQILFTFTQDYPRWRVRDLSQTLHLHPSTVSRLLNTAKRAGIVEQVPENGQYKLGLRILALSQVVTAHLNPVQIAYPFLSSLAVECQENAFLSVLDGLEAVTVAQVAGPQILVVRPTVGIRLRPNWTSGGKLLLAYGPEKQVEVLIRRGLVGRTANTLMDPDQLRAELRRIREQGYAIADQEFEEGLVAVAAPVRDATERVIAAVSVSGSSARVQGERLQRIIGLVCRAGEQISRALSTLPTEVWTGLGPLVAAYRLEESPAEW